MRFFLCILTAMLLGQRAEAQVGLSGGYSKCLVQLGTDANGWTVFNQPNSSGGGGQIFYISTNDGSDSYNGKEVAHTTGNTGPWKTITAHVLSQAAADIGKDDWFLLKKGDVFTNQQFYPQSGFAGGGLDCLHPMLIGSYDPGQPLVPDPYGSFQVAGITCVGTTMTVTTVAPHGWTNGNPYEVVLTQELPAEFNGEFASTITGTTTLTATVGSCPDAADTLHGIIALDRPIVEMADTFAYGCLPRPIAAGTGDFLAVVGIKCYSTYLDPLNAAFDPVLFAKGGGNGAGMTQENVSTWKLLEDNEFTGMYYDTLIFEQDGNVLTLTPFVSLRRNVFYRTATVYTSGLANLNIYENYNFYGAWDPVAAAGVSVTVNIGASTFTWPTTPPLASGTACSNVVFSGGTLPTGITSGTIYDVVNLSGNTFQVAPSSGIGSGCSGTPITLGGSPSGVIGYWAGSVAVGAFDNGLYPQGNEYGHQYYLQNSAQGVVGTWNINLTGNVMAFSAGIACECQGAEYENLLFQNSIQLGMGKAGAILANNNFTASWNGIFETTNYYTQPSSAIYGNQAFAMGDQLGTYTADHNLIAYVPAGSVAAAQGVGIFPTGSNNYPATSVITNNIVCSIATPIKPLQGQPVSFNSIVHGSGYTPKSGSSTYLSVNQEGIPITPLTGFGSGGGVQVTVNGATGAVTNIVFEYNQYGKNYHVGDIVSSNNAGLGGLGSGWQATVAAVTGLENGVAWNLGTTLGSLVGGSNYSAAYDNVGTTTNSTNGTGDVVHVTINPGGQVVAVYQQDSSGYGYQVGDTIGFVSLSGSGSGAGATVATVVNNTYSNNTYRAADCTAAGLNAGGDTPGHGQTASVAPPLAPLGSDPPTDVIGTYFESLPYGYQATVPAILSGQTSTWEQGYISQASLQQKANWDTNLTAHAVLNWARPQFGMANPY